MARRCYRTKKEVVRDVVAYAKKIVPFLPGGPWRVESASKILEASSWNSSYHGSIKCKITQEGLLGEGLHVEVRTASGKEKGVRYEHIIHHFIIDWDTSSPTKHRRKQIILEIGYFPRLKRFIADIQKAAQHLLDREMNADVHSKILREIYFKSGSMRREVSIRPGTSSWGTYELYNSGRVTVTIKDLNVEVELRLEGYNDGHAIRRNFEFGDPELVEKVSEYVDRKCLKRVLDQVDDRVDGAKKVFHAMGERNYRYRKVAVLFEELQKALKDLPKKARIEAPRKKLKPKKMKKRVRR